MELKRCNLQHINTAKSLLIVPYGIETDDDSDRLYENVVLLIVPYGIETFFYHRYNYFRVHF